MKRTNNRRTQLLFAFALGFLAIPATLVTVAGTRLYAQAAPKQRIVDGKVTDKAEAPLPGAVVYLKDSKSLSVKTFICDEEGKFHFGQLSQNTDYQLWADHNGVKSKTKNISSFDDKNSYYFTLTVEPK
jgi:hypothetical protein